MIHEQTLHRLADGEMATRVRTHDWSATPVGPRTAWPPPLDAVVDLILSSGFPMVVLWGPELVQIYNDAYRVMMGAKHPAGLGQPTRECWPEAWHITAPIFERVLAGETLTFEDARYTVDRGEGPRDAWFTLSYSPLHDTRGNPGGVLVTALETTERRRTRLAEEALQHSEERHAFLLRLNDRLLPLADPLEIQDQAARLLGEHLGASRVGYAEDVGDGASIAVTRNYANGVPSIEGRYRYDDYGPALLHELRAGLSVVRSDIAGDLSLTAAERAAHQALQCGAMIDVPLLRGGRLRAVFFVHHRTPRVWSSDDLTLIEAVAARTWDAAERARVEVTLRESEARQTFLVRLGDEMRPLADPNAIKAAAASVLGRHLDVAAAGYVEVEPDGNTMFADNGYNDGRLPTHRGWYRLSSLGEGFRAVIAGGEELAVEDFATDSRGPDGGPAAAHAIGMRAVLGVPLVKGGRLAAFFYAMHHRPRQWSADDRQLMREVAERTWDAVERARAEAALRASEERFQLAVRATNDAIWDWDLTTNALEWNDAVSAVFGYQPEEVGPDLTWWQENVHPDDRERVFASIRQVVHGGGTAWSESYLYRCGDGHYAHVLDRGYVARGPDGTPTRMVGAMQDVTASTEAQNARRQAEQEAARQKDEFIAILAHELRNPLAPIRTSAAILGSRASADPLIIKCRDVIDRQTTHMARLLDDLLDVSRLSRGKLTLQRAIVRLADVLDAAIETSRPLIDQQGCHLTVNVPPGDLFVNGDAARLTQVFANVLNNAAKYNTRGGLIVLSVARGDGEAAVTIRDTGVGLPAEFVDRIFDLFTQAASPHDRASGGLGIGLALARRLLELHGGSVRASSAGPGRGSEFTIRLPTLGAAGAARDQKPDGREQPLHARILIAEDNHDAAEMLATLLTGRGCEVSAVHDGQSAVREAERVRPDVLLLDIGLPLLDGYGACRQIRSQAWSAGLKIIALTGWGQEEDRRRATMAGFDRHLVKPVDPERLVAVLRDVLSH